MHEIWRKGIRFVYREMIDGWEGLEDVLEQSSSSGFRVRMAGSIGSHRQGVLGYPGGCRHW